MRSLTMSPGTSSRAGTVLYSPSRSTVTSFASRCLRALSALSARCSWKKSSPALTSSMTAMIVKSSHFCTTAERIAAASIIHGIGPQKRRKTRCQSGSSFSWISL